MIITGIILLTNLKDMTGTVTVVSEETIMTEQETTITEEGEILPELKGGMIIQGLKEEMIM